MGSAVWSGVLGTNDPSGPSNSGLIWARKGAFPVAVGPVTNHQLWETLDNKKDLPGKSSGEVWKYCGTLAPSTVRPRVRNTAPTPKNIMKVGNIEQVDQWLLSFGDFSAVTTGTKGNLKKMSLDSWCNLVGKVDALSHFIDSILYSCKTPRWKGGFKVCLITPREIQIPTLIQILFSRHDAGARGRCSKTKVQSSGRIGNRSYWWRRKKSVSNLPLRD